MQRARRIRKELEAVFSNTRPYPGIIADPITGEFGTGIPYLEWLQFLTNELNKKETNGRSTPMGHIVQSKSITSNSTIKSSRKGSRIGKIM